MVIISLSSAKSNPGNEEIFLLSSIVEYLVAVLEDELDGVVLRVHVRHLALEAVVAHDCRCEDYGEVLGCHLRKELVFGKCVMK